MVQQVTIRITPSGPDSNILSVKEAMEQVLDAISFFGKAEAHVSSKHEIVWRLVSISKNSPFTLVAEPFGKDPSENVSEVAEAVVKACYAVLRSVFIKGPIPEWFQGTTVKPIENIIKRNLNGIGTTEFNFGGKYSAIIVSHKTATEGQNRLEISRLQSAPEDLTRKEHGSIEGQVLSVGSYYNKPVVVIKERLLGVDVKCIIQKELIEKIGENQNWEDVWVARRVLVEGVISYDEEGIPRFVDANLISRITPATVDLSASPYKGVLQRKSPTEYLDLLREGALD